VIASIVGTLAAGAGLPVRHFVEGAFAFFDPILIIAVGMIFMETMTKNGVLAGISVAILKTFHRWPTVMILAIALFVMLPGMLTGLSTMCILTTGALAMPVLIAMGMPRIAVGSLIVILSVCGGVAPPICLPAMIIGGGADMPYVGLTKPLLLVSIPVAIAAALPYRFKYLRKINVGEVLAKLEFAGTVRCTALDYVPIVFVIMYMFGETTFARYFPRLGIPLIFAVGVAMSAAIGVLKGTKIDFFGAAGEGLRKALPVMAILIGVGVFLQTITLTGIRGYLTTSAFFLPDALKYGIALMMPLLGSAFGSASIIGVPLLYVFIGRNELVVTASLVMMASVGDVMPPPSLLCAYAAQMLGEKNHFKILRQSAPVIVFAMLWALLMLIYAADIANAIF
jgi:TRAP-type C4-dicarboxylate transport system permease large subunit